MYDVMGWTRYVMTIGTSAMAASSVVVPDLQIPASDAAKTSSGSPRCTRIGPGSRYTAPPAAVPAAMIWTSGRAEATRLGARWRRRPVFEGMAHERCRDAALAKKRLLERQDHREPVHRRELAH